MADCEIQRRKKKKPRRSITHNQTEHNVQTEPTLSATLQIELCHIMCNRQDYLITAYMHSIYGTISGQIQYNV